MTEHEIKCYPGAFAALLTGEKRHEVRPFDRPYKVGDHLWFREWEAPIGDAQEGSYTGRTARFRVSHITQPQTFGLPIGIGVMSVEPLPEKGRPDPLEIVRRALARGQEVFITVRNKRQRGQAGR